MPASRKSRTRLLWMGGSIVLAAVTLLSILQYRLLGRLRDASLESRSRQAEDVANEIVGGISRYFGEHADASLDVTPEELYDSAALVARLKANDFRGAREFFAVRLDPAGQPRVLYFDREQARLVERPEAPSMPAIEFAMYAWSSPERRRILRRPTRTVTMPVRTNERATFINLDLFPADREHRIALHPVGMVDEFTGATGFIIDHRYALDVLLPALIERAHRASDHSGLHVSVRDASTGAVSGWIPSSDVRPLARSRAGFGLRDAVVEVYGDDDAAATLASRSFALNVALLSFIVAIAILGALLTIRAARAQTRLAAMKSDFISNVTHELRTPLSSIRLFARLIRTGTPDTHHEGVTYARHIEEESERLARMVENVLDLSRLEGAAGPLTTFDLRSVVHAALERHSVLLHARGIEVQCRLPGTPVLLAGDAGSLTSAVSNLVENAIHYSGGEDGSIEVELHARPGEAEITVRDRGIGIDAGEHERIFERFYRGDDAVVHNVPGSGLGLAIVRSAVEVHRGRVAVSSRRGGGSTFTIHLPAREAGGAMLPEGAG